MTGPAGNPEASATTSAVGLHPVAIDAEAILRPWLRPGTPIFRITLRPTFVVSARDRDPKSGLIAEVSDSRWFAGMSVVAFAGIAHPHRLSRDLRHLGAEVVSFHPFPDHHVFTDGEIGALLRKVDEFKPDAFVTTEKDVARLRGTPQFERLLEKGLIVLRLEAVVAPGDAEAFRALVVAAASGRAGGTP